MFPSININNNSYASSHPDASPSTPVTPISATFPPNVATFSSQLGMMMPSNKKQEQFVSAMSSQMRKVEPSTSPNANSPSYHHFGSTHNATGTLDSPNVHSTMTRKNSKQLLIQRKQHKSGSVLPSTSMQANASPIRSHSHSALISTAEHHSVGSFQQSGDLVPPETTTHFSTPRSIASSRSSGSDSAELSHVHTLQEQVRQQNELMEKITSSCYKELQQMKQKFSSKSRTMDSCIFAWGIITKVEFTKSFHVLVKKYEKLIRDMKKQHEIDKKECQLQWEQKFFEYKQQLLKQQINLMSDLEKSHMDSGNVGGDAYRSFPIEIQTTGNPYALLQSNSSGDSEYDDIRELKKTINRLNREVQHTKLMNEELRNELKLQYEEKRDIEQEKLKILRECERTVSKIERKKESVWEYQAEIKGLKEKNNYFMDELKRKQYQVRILTRKLLTVGLIDEEEFHRFLRSDSFSFAADRERAAMRTYTDDLPDMSKDLAVCAVQTDESALRDVTAEEEISSLTSPDKNRSKKNSKRHTSSTKFLYKLNKNLKEEVNQKKKEIKALQAMMGNGHFDASAFLQLQEMVHGNKENVPLKEDMEIPTIRKLWDLVVRLVSAEPHDESEDETLTSMPQINSPFTSKAVQPVNSQTLQFPDARSSTKGDARRRSPNKKR